MKKFILGAVILVEILVSVASANEKKTSTYSLYEVQGFLHSVDKVKNTLIQVNTKEVTNDLVSHTCGPTSLLFVRNYFHYMKYYEPETFLLDIGDSVGALKRLYEFNYGDSTSYNSEMTLSSVPYAHSLKKISIERWKWNNVARAGTNYDYNLYKLKDNLKNNNPLIIALNPKQSSNPRDRHSLNPAGNGGHIVVVYAYFDYKDDRERDMLIYFDPYYGGTHFMYQDEIKTASMGHSLSYLLAKP